MSGNGGRTRRELLVDAVKAAAAASIGGLVGCSGPGVFPDVGGHWPICQTPDGGFPDAGAPAPVTPAVVEVLRKESVGASDVIQPAVVADMLSAGLTALANQVKTFNDGGQALVGGPDTGDAGQADSPWKVLLPNYKAGQVIGLKVNCLGPTATSPALVRALIASLRDGLGIAPQTAIVVWDRFKYDIDKYGRYSADDLAGAPYRGNLLRGVKTTEREADFTDGNGYGDAPCIAPKGTKGNYPRLSRILTDQTNLTINLPVLKRHPESGYTGALKNSYGMFDNPAEFHKTVITTALPELYAIPAIRNSISLTILDALLGVITGDNASFHDCAPSRLLLAQDPVAMDSYGWDLLTQLRVAQGYPADDADIPNAWLDYAQKLGLGTRTYSLVKA